MASAFFSGSETTLTSITSTRAALLTTRNPAKYEILKTWVDNRRRYLAMLLVGNTLSNILATILAYQMALSLWPSYPLALSVVVLTLCILVFGEIAPRALGSRHADSLAVPVLRIAWLLDKLVFPLTFPLSKIPVLLSGKTAVSDEESITSEDEIALHIRRGIDQSVFGEAAQGELLISAVEFADIMVKEIMVPRPAIVWLNRNTSARAAISKLTDSGHSRVPVCDENLDQVVGLLYAKDLLQSSTTDHYLESTMVQEVMRSEIHFVPETQKINTLLTDMRRRGLHMAVVVDEFGVTAGLVTLEDIIEELVGEIRDEFDPQRPDIREVGDGRWQVKAEVSLHDLEDRTGIALPDSGDYESVGGFVIATHGRIPKRGKIIDAGSMEMIVIDADRRHVQQVEIRLKPSTTDPRN